MNKEKSLEQFKKNINLMFENNDKEIYLHKDDALKIEYYIYSLEQQCKKQEEVINRIFNETKETRDIINNNRCDNILKHGSLINYLGIVEDLLKENQELKSQLKGTTHCFDEEEHEKLKKQLEELKEEKQEWINLLAMFKNQQKEFIKYLENEIKIYSNTYMGEMLKELKEILQKYKSIIGVSDENNMGK